MKLSKNILITVVTPIIFLLAGQSLAQPQKIGSRFDFISNGSFPSAGGLSFSGTTQANEGRGVTFYEDGTMTIEVASWLVSTTAFGDTNITAYKNYPGTLNGSTWTSDGTFTIAYVACDAGLVCEGIVVDENTPKNSTVAPFSLDICTGGNPWNESDTPQYTTIGGQVALDVQVGSTNSVSVTDSDGDCVADGDDAYPGISLGGRTDTDRDGRPDDCDAVCVGLGMVADDDDDGDGFIDTIDTCPLIIDPGQEDTDNDTVGDACDNCLSTANPGQAPSAVNSDCGKACERSGGCGGITCVNQ